jgi:hypothetical protein
MRRTGPRVLVFLVLLSVIATPVTASGPGVEPPGFVGTLWHALMNLFASGTSRAKRGSIMDPDGVTATGSACRGENGSVMDPNGCPAAGNQAGATPDLGSVMDPNG